MRPQLADLQRGKHGGIKSPVVIPVCVHAQLESWWNWSFFPFLGSKNGGLLLELKSCHFGRFDWPPFSETKRGGRGGARWQSTCGGVLDMRSQLPYPSPDTGRARVLDCGVAPRFGVS